MRRLYIYHLLLLIPFLSSAQISNISGIVNSYTAVTGLNICSNSVVVASSSGLAKGDRVMIIQMKGADVNVSNTASFGAITNYNDAGNFELNTIDSISGTEVFLKFMITRTYTIAGKVQLVKIASYANADVVDTLTCTVWNGTTGGVIAIEADTLFVNAPVSANGKGFRGGGTVNSGSTCTFGGFTPYFTTLSTLKGGQKGEGISEYNSTYEAGRGRLANGGGGGNDHNSGGGGGGNAGYGGQGGERIKNIFSCPGPYPGRGGDSLNYTGNRLFLGGGGGGGHGNNNLAGKGGNGGGIIFIRAYYIKMVSDSISAKGENGYLGKQDGAGGGGAGGTILLYLDSLGDLITSFSGGKGGDNDNDQSADCCGPAGGGGPGAFLCRYVKSGTYTVGTNPSPGAAGLTTNTQSPCYGSSNNATQGQSIYTPSSFLSYTSALPDDTLPFILNFAVISNGNVASLCSGDSLQLSASGGNAYAWSPSAGLSDTAIFNPWAKPSATTTYVVQVRNSSGCTDTASVLIDYTTRPVAFVGNDTSICAGDSITLFSSGGPAYLWTPSAGLNDTTKFNPLAKPLTSTRYTLEVSAAANCKDTASILIQVYSVPSAQAGNDTVICSGDSIQLIAGGGNNYIWSPSYGLSDTAIADPWASPDSTIRYNVEVSVASGCRDTASVLITVLPAPVVFAGNDTTVCDGDSVQLQASGGTSYLWTPSAGLSDPAISNPFAKPMNVTLYAVRITNGMCSATDSVLVTVLQPVNGNAGTDQVVCGSDSVQMNAFGGSIYSWSPTLGLSDPSIPDPKAFPAVTTTYTVTVSNGICTDRDNVLVTVDVKPVSDAGQDDTICAGESVILSASGTGSSYQWSTGDTSRSITVFPTLTTQYRLTESGALCTGDEDTVVVVVIPPVIANAGSDKLVCGGDSVQLNATGGGIYSWSPSIGLSYPGISNPKAFPPNTTVYKLTVSNGICSDTDDVLVTVGIKPLSDAGIDDSICAGQSVVLTAMGTGNRYLWSTGDTIRSITVSPLTSTKYKLVESGLQCAGNEDSVTITVFPQATALFSANPAVGSTPLNVNFKNQSAQAQSYIWNFGDGSPVSSQSDPDHLFSKQGMYKVVLIAAGNAGCSDTAFITILVRDSLILLIPNVFTPDNDSYNDLFEIINTGVRDMQGRIYNRWGQEVYAWQMPGGAWWNGMMNNEESPAGVYYYALKVTDLKGDSREFHGTLTLIR